jgi:CHASE3 domain sensor protein
MKFPDICVIGLISVVCFSRLPSPLCRLKSDLIAKNNLTMFSAVCHLLGLLTACDYVATRLSAVEVHHPGWIAGELAGWVALGLLFGSACRSFLSSLFAKSPAGRHRAKGNAHAPITGNNTFIDSASRSMITHTRPPLPVPFFMRLIILPIAISGVLCVVLSYGLRNVERKSLAVDKAELVIAHSNNLIKLMVDEETGLRGYLLTKNPMFLQPFQVADERMNSEFSALFGLVGNFPNQTRQLAELQTAHQDWKQEANDEISSPLTGIPGNAFLLKRKQKMDSIRGEMDRFADWAETQRSQTLSHALRSNRIILFGSVDFAILLAVFFIWQIQKGIRDILQTDLELQRQCDERSS